MKNIMFLFSFFVLFIACNNTDSVLNNDKKKDIVIDKIKKDTVNAQVKIKSDHKKLSVLVLPPYDDMANRGISPYLQEYLETEIAKDTDIILIKFSEKKFKDLDYNQVYDKRYCKKLIEKVKADIFIMSKLVLVKSTGNTKTDFWKFELKLFNFNSKSQTISKIKADNMTADEIKNYLKDKQHDLTSEIKNTK